MEWTLVVPFLAPVDLIRLSHTHKLAVPRWCWKNCWKETWHARNMPCYHTACRVAYLVDKHGAPALAESILTNKAAVRGGAALALIAPHVLHYLKRFPKLLRYIS